MFPEIENNDNLVVKAAPAYGSQMLDFEADQLISKVLKFSGNFKQIQYKLVLHEKQSEGIQHGFDILINNGNSIKDPQEKK